MSNYSFDFSKFERTVRLVTHRIILILLAAGAIQILNLTYGCVEAPRIIINPLIYKSPIKKVALLPIAADNETDAGTFYSTNHFYNIINDGYPGVDIVAIDTVRKFDCKIAIEQFEFIKRYSSLNIGKFLYSKLGQFLYNEKVDAVLIGGIDSVAINQGLSYTKSYCLFTYYLVALDSGKILWESNVSGENVLRFDKEGSRYFPPLDAAISDGLDKMANDLPFER